MKLDQFPGLYLWICLSLGLLSYTLAKYVEECSVHKDQCRAQLLKDGNKIRYDVSCDCTPDAGTDVSKKLQALTGNMCISKVSRDVQLDESSLVIIKCSVQNKTFPLLVLHDLKMSKNFSIHIEQSKTIRLKSHTIISRFANTEIHALFKESSIYGFGSGWFTNASYVDLRVKNCMIDVIEAQFMTDYSPNAEVHLTMEATDIATIKGMAFMLPKNSTVKMTGVTVGQWERFAYQGGRSLRIEATKFGVLEERGINIYGMKELYITASIFASIHKKAIFENIIPRQISDNKINEVKPIDIVVIAKNKFVTFHDESFSGLCWEENLFFEENFIINVNPKPIFKTKMCSKERNWDKALTNNFIKCDGCFNYEKLDEQNCAFYRSAFCLCGSDVEVELFHPYNNSKIPCSISLYHHLNQECSHNSGEMIYKCKIISHEVTHLFSNRTVYTIGSGAVGNSYPNIYFYTCLLLVNLIRRVLTL